MADVRVSDRWISPGELACPGALGEADVASWRERGYAFVQNLVPRSLVDAARTEALAFYPQPGTPEAAAVNQFGSGQRFRFPAGSDAVNEITLHPSLLTAVARLLNVHVTDIRLTQSDAWPKYGRNPGQQTTDDVQDNNDQRMHCDYPNHTLTHPPRWDSPEAVEVILYLSDVEECGGATAVVPRQGPEDPAYPWPIVGTPGVAGFDYVNSRGLAEDYLRKRAPRVAEFREQHLYAREAKARYNVGSVLLYRHDTWHRGTPVKSGALRLVHNLTFKKAASEWVSVLHPGWAWAMYGQARIMENLVAGASVEQRALLGFPVPGSDYWTADTVAAVQARYAAYGIDMSEYRAAVERSGR